MTKYAKIMATFGVLAGLGVASLPLATFAANNSETTVKVTVQEGISIANDNATAEAGSATSNLTAATNNAAGLKITVKDKDEDTSLRAAGITGSVAGVDFIPTAASGTGSWSLKGGDLAVDTAMVKNSETALVVKNTTGPSTEAVAMTYRIEPGAAQRQGTYEDVIVYTVTKN